MTQLEIINSKIHTTESIKHWLNIWRFKGQKIVFTNGCFDILHQGHVDYLSKAADLGDVLIIGVNTDSSVRTIKDPNRPINDEHSRAMILAAMHFTSAVTLFDEKTPYDLIKIIQPDVLVKGADYKVEDIVGADIVLAKGGQVITIEFLPGYSTTNIINKIKG
ncbi:MAG: D-glycero-beta-D-manno-heptose 1-phosphate adenylyltransferase [Bacteroidota bacterium]